MKRDSLFWGGLLIILGALFFLQAQGLITGGVFKWFWAIFLITLGIWIIAGVYMPSSGTDGKTFSIPHQSAREANVTFEHGAGHIIIKSGAAGEDFLVGSAGTLIEHSYKLNEDKLNVRISAGPTFIPFVGPESGAWEFSLNPNIPTKLSVGAGASQIELHLKDLLVSNLKLETGASSTRLTVPARGASFVDIEAGAASIEITVPSGVAARIRMKNGVASLDLDKSRYKEINNDLYQSADFDSAKDRTEINVEAGLASVKIL